MRRRGIAIVSLGVLLIGLVPVGFATAETPPCPSNAAYCTAIGGSGHTSHEHTPHGAGQVDSGRGHSGGHSGGDH